MASKSPKRRSVRPTHKTRAKKGAACCAPKRSIADVPSTTKIAALLAALSTPKGATLAQMMALTGWQKHSVRGAISRVAKKELGCSIVSEKTGAERVYRVRGRK
jgi:hypothetical protein